MITLYGFLFTHQNRSFTDGGIHVALQNRRIKLLVHSLPTSISGALGRAQSACSDESTENKTQETFLGLGTQKNIIGTLPQQLESPLHDQQYPRLDSQEEVMEKQYWWEGTWRRKQSLYGLMYVGATRTHVESHSNWFDFQKYQVVYK